MTFKRENLYLFLLIALLLMMFATYPVKAEPVNVLDCLENEEDCEEEEAETGVIETDESDNNGDLVGNDSFKASSLFFNIIKMIVALFFVLGLIYVILLFLRRRNKLLQHHELLENLGGISLGQNKSLQLIRIGSHIYVVGVGEQVDLMLEITEPEVLEALLSEESSDQEVPFLKQLLSKNENKTDEKNNFMNQLDNELNKLQNNREKLIHKAVEKDDEYV